MTQAYALHISYSVSLNYNVVVKQATMKAVIIIIIIFGPPAQSRRHEN